MSEQSALVERSRAVITPNYRPQPLVFERGEGAWLWDADGNRFLDFAAGIAVSALGYNHPELTKAITEQARNLLHISNLWLNRPSIELMEALSERCFADRVYFANSGAEANEAALKIARRYQQAVLGEDRYEFICAEKSFHGRTWAAISATGQPKYHKGFGPLVPGFHHVPYGDLDAVEAKVNAHTCAVFVEPLQGEGGIIVPPVGYLEGLRALCDTYGLLLIFDEVQTGVGRTGAWFCHQHSTITPDIMTLAKGIAGGVPLGAMVCTEAVSQGFQPGVHASTFGGNPLATRAGLAVVQAIEAEGLVDNAAQVGALLGEGLQTLVDAFDPVVEVRGMGLMRGLAIDPDKVDKGAVRLAAQRRGLLMTTAGPDALRFTPPLVVGPAHVEEAVRITREALAEVIG